MTVTIKLLDYLEYNELIEKGRRDHRSIYHYFEPDYGYYNPWYNDPLDWKTRYNANWISHGKERLSVHYWQHWAGKRPPITLMCPDRSLWEIDTKSSNGTGWIVTSWPDFLTCTPSIVTKSYHGFLTNGAFSDDLEGRVY